jgi:PST family polysaccharide transporter
MEQLFVYQLIGDFFKIAAWLIAYLMLAKAMTKLFIITEILFSTIYLVLGHVCVDLFGLIGLTIAFAINYFVYFLFMGCYFRKLIFSKNE